MAEQKIWEGSAGSGAGGYRNLAQNYRAKHGNLVGFLEKYGAFQRGDKLYKVRVDGERVKLASLTGYNAYQSRRQGREGYNKVKRELLALGVDPKEIDAFIKADKAEYKQIVSEVKGADKISAEPVQKGHVGSLKTGSPDVAGNIEPELRSVNVGKQSQSPIPEALLAEGRPRTSAEAFLRWRDPSGLPQPTDYTYEQRQLLRSAQTPEEVDELLTEFDKSKQTRLIDDLNLTPAQRRQLSNMSLEAKDTFITNLKKVKNLPGLGMVFGGGLATAQLMQGNPAAAAETAFDTAVSEIPIVGDVLEPAPTADATLQGRTDPQAYAAQYKEERKKAKQEQSNFITDTLKLISDAI